MQASTEVEVPPVSEWLRRQAERQMVERLARRGSIRYAKREGVLSRLRRRLGWR